MNYLLQNENNQAAVLFPHLSYFYYATHELKVRKYMAQSLGCQLATWQKSRLSKVAGSLIKQMNKLYSAFCILTLLRPEGNLLWPTCTLVLHCTALRIFNNLLPHPISSISFTVTTITNSMFHNALLWKLSKPYSVLKQELASSENKIQLCSSPQKGFSPQPVPFS